jgi:hypothetical protein
LDTFIWGERAWGVPDIRSMSSIRPICKCRCPPGWWVIGGTMIWRKKGCFHPKFNTTFSGTINLNIKVSVVYMARDV